MWRNRLPDECNNYFLYPLGRECRQTARYVWNTFFGLWAYERQVKPYVGYQCQFFPFYFAQKGMPSANNYAAIFPLGGRVRNLLGRDSVEWFLWPMWIKTCREGTTHYWYPWPFVCHSTGTERGFAFWPLGGHFYKEGHYEHRYCLWPLIYCRKTWRPRCSVQQGFIPFFAYEKDDNVKDLSIIWPIWGHRWERSPGYEERRLLWPLWVQGRGQFRCIRRWAPFHTYSENRLKGTSKEWILWPFIKQIDIRENKMHIHREQFFYFLFWKQTQTHEELPFKAEKTHFWPFYSYWDNGQGRCQFQMLSLFEVFFPNNQCVQRIYNPLFSLYRFEVCGDCRKQSLFWGLINEELSPHLKRFSIGVFLDYLKGKEEQSMLLLKGLLGYKRKDNEKTLFLFWKQFKTHPKLVKRKRCLKVL